MFFIFSNRFGCLGSVLLSAVVTVALLFHVRGAALLNRSARTAGSSGAVQHG